jgi:hypothetical protein
MSKVEHLEQYKSTVRSILYILKKSKEAQLSSVEKDIVNLKKLSSDTTKNNLKNREYYFQIAFCEDIRRAIVNDLSRVDFILEYLSQCEQLSNSYSLLSQQISSGSFLKLTLEELFRAIEYNKMPSKFT